MKVLILGYGSSGKAAEALAQKLGYDVTVLEDARRGKDSAAPVMEAHGCRRGKDSAAPVVEAQELSSGETAPSTGEAESLPLRDEAPCFAIVSPGVPLTSPLIAACRARGIPLKSELQFGCEELKRQGWKLLAVTGSKGKSSVVKVVADAIDLAGMHAVACGNYGLPVSAVAAECRSGKDSASPAGSASPTVKPGVTTLATGEAESLPLRRFAVVEVSSFMMETTELPADTFEAAAILNLQEDHLDRHGSVETYHALKRKLLDFAKVSIECDAASCDSSLFAASYFDNEVLRVNARCAAALMHVAGLDDACIRGAFAAFKPLPHRFERVALIDGVEYIDDSKATSVAALIAGVAMCTGGVRLIAGGLPKGDDPKSAVSILTERVKKVYLIGQSAEAFAAAWKSSVDCEICVTMEKAVAAARREAVKGDKVLLSPGTASFDQFKSFGERGDEFARLVKKENT